MTNHLLSAVVLFVASSSIAAPCPSWGDEPVNQIQVGLAKREITPERPLRLSGYGSRSEVMSGVRDPIFVRALVIGSGDERCVMVSVEGIAVTSSQTQRLHAALREEYGLDRARLVLCSTHSHTAPHPPDGLTNLFRTPVTESQQQDLEDYADFVHAESLSCVEQAIASQRPGSLSVGTGKASFAAHRRVIREGVWTGFGVTPDGPTDQRVQVMIARDADDNLLGAVFQYACHCTTLGPSFNELTGDWAGLAAAELEDKNENTVFVPIIGCGADANPEPRDAYEHAVAHGHELASAVGKVIRSETLTRINRLPTARFGFAGLSAELPSRQELQQALQDANVNRQRWAKNMLEIWDAQGRLPESYPAPIHTWDFGQQLAWVFLGGEVVVQYQMRLERELNQFDRVWVAAYVDDVFAYVAAEDMRDAGGYEVDFSMVYYNQPGRWQSGTEDLLVSRVREILDSPKQNEDAKSPEDSLNCLRVADGFNVELVAHEPLVVDPVNLAFDADGSVWVVEMSDYPRGTEGGRVKRLRDTDGDGRLDKADVFLNGLEFPTSVLPWRDGAIVIAAPDIFFARDTDDDGVADQREVLLTGIGHANPQHRASGFEWGLDGWVYFGAGDDTKTLKSRRNGTSESVSHCDVRWNPDTGDLERLAGATQFVRSRDRWGRWFGNSNSVPLFTYSVDRVDLLRRNPDVPHRRLVLDPGVAPPVFPASRTVDRFNDLFAKNRFTSACSSIVIKGAALGQSMRDAALICEPVHNLVARFALEPNEASVRGQRFEEDAKVDWLASTDTWFRPVRAIEAPDGSVWIVDMYRNVIEHPQWIPAAWQERLDVRAGETAGRIFRVSCEGKTAGGLTNLTAMNTDSLIELLRGDAPVLRNLASQQLLWRSPPDLATALRGLFDESQADVRLQGFGLLTAAGVDTEADWERVFQDRDPRVVAWAIRAAARDHASARQPLIRFAARNAAGASHAMVDFELLLALGNFDGRETAGPLKDLIRRTWQHQWSLEAISMASQRHAPVALGELLGSVDRSSKPLDSEQWNRVQRCADSLWKRCNQEARKQIVNRQLGDRDSSLTTTQWIMVLTAAPTYASDVDRHPESAKLLASVIKRGRETLNDPNATVDLRVRACQLIGCAMVPVSEQLQDLRRTLGADQPGPVRRAGLAVAYRIPAAATAQILLDAWDQLLPDERATAGATLLQRGSWTIALIQALERGRLDVDDLDASTVNGLRNCQNYNVMKRFGTLLATPSPSERKQIVNQYVNAIDAGETVSETVATEAYRRHCSVCHEKQVDPSGQSVDAIGPPLTNLKHWSTLQWVTAVLEPSANVEAKYKQYKVLTKSGQVFSGVVVKQGDTDVQLGLADSKRIRIQRSDIERMEASGVSMMPQGLGAKITPQQLGGIIRLLSLQ